MSFFRFLIATAFLATLLFYPLAVSAQNPIDKVGNFLGCRENLDASPYCADPEIRALVYEHFRFRELVKASGLDVAQINRIGAVTGGVQNSLMMEAKSCGADEECLKSAVSSATDAFYSAAEIERPSPLSAQEIAAFAAAEGASIEKFPERAALLRELDQAYAKEWILVERMQIQSRIPHPRPDDWTKSWERKCNGDVVCLDEKRQSFEAMVEARDNAIAKVNASRNRITAEKQREIRREQAQVAETARREAEVIRRQTELRAMAVAAAEEAKEKFGPDSILYHVFFQDFEKADWLATNRVRAEIYENKFSLFSELFNQQLKGRLEYGIVANRRNFIVADYALTRLNRLGNCGEAVELIVRQLGEAQTYRNMLGQEYTIPAGTSRFYTPTKFAQYVRLTSLERGDNLFADEVSAIFRCDSPLRIVLEQRLIEFANWQP